MTFELTEAEATVLADFLWKNTNNENALEIVNRAQRQVLWNLECVLEKELPFDLDVTQAEKEILK